MSEPDDTLPTLRVVQYVLVDGARVRVGGSVAVPDVQVLVDALGPGVREVDVPVDNPNDVYWDGTTVQPIPPRPSEFHVFDYTMLQWVDPDSLAQARWVKSEAIVKERDDRIMAVIAYDGLSVDADARAQTNISNKLTEIDARAASGYPMPAQMLVWRDADNITHNFPDVATYKAWLQGLAVVIAERATEAYAWSWQRKAVLESLTTLADILAFDPQV